MKTNGLTCDCGATNLKFDEVAFYNPNTLNACCLDCNLVAEASMVDGDADLI